MALYNPRSIFHLARLVYVRPETFGTTLVCSWPKVTTYFQVLTKILCPVLIFPCAPHLITRVRHDLERFSFAYFEIPPGLFRGRTEKITENLRTVAILAETRTKRDNAYNLRSYSHPINVIISEAVRRAWQAPSAALKYSVGRSLVSEFSNARQAYSRYYNPLDW